MSGVFGASYAAAYDQIYREKDYPRECDLIEHLFARYSRHPVRSVLDLGCGTGAHTLLLARRGYSVTGVDKAGHMLRIARAKARALPSASQPRFVRSDLAAYESPQRADAALMMFAVLGYQTAPGTAQAALAATRRNLREGGLLVGDVWYSPAVRVQQPGQRWRVDKRGRERVLRFSSGTFDARSDTCTVDIHIWKLRSTRVIAEIEERHRLRSFSRQQLAGLFRETGFSLLRVGAVPDFDRRPSAETWNVAFVARAVRARSRTRRT